MGFDINCGVRLVRTNLTLEDVLPVKEELTQSLFDHIPVGVGTKGVVPIKAADLNDVLVRERERWGCCLVVAFDRCFEKNTWLDMPPIPPLPCCRSRSSSLGSRAHAAP